MTHRNRARLSKLSLALVAALAAAPVFAQSTSSGIGGTIVGANGQPVAGAEVTITHTESGTVSRAITDASGNYSARGLRVGGPYTITVTKAGEGTTSRENVYLQLNQVADVDATLNADVATLGSVQVVGTGSSVFGTENRGVGTSVSGRELEVMPRGNRSIDDVARLDPRITVTDQASGAISVAGMNNRYNNISVDGMSQGDPFGLNSNGMPYTGSPISVDTIDAYDIKVSDYDVASDSVGASINAVTKSGTNEFHGSVYYARKGADWVGSRNGDDYTAYDKDETKGFTLGGPILKDKLFFFASYETQKISDFGGSAGGGDGLSNGNVTQAEIDRAIKIADGLGLTPGTYGQSLGSDLENKRYLAKIDWNISDSQRASITYQRTEESRPVPYDLASNAAVLSSRWYNNNNITRNASLQLFSDWTDNFSTEAKVSVQKFHQENGNAVDQPTINIWSANGGQIRMGEDRNRHENRINTDKVTASLFGTLYAGDHTFKFGADYLKNDVLNLYGRDLHGVYEFGNSADSNKGISGLDDFAAGDYNRYDIRAPLPGYTVADTAAAIVFSQISPFVQDTWQVNSNLSVQYGVRVNIPKAEKAPPRNPAFEPAFGFPNDYKLGSKNKVVLPRASFNYTFDTELSSQLRGGIGAFQSIPPFVWLANPYQNNGVAAGSYTSFDPAAYPFSTDPYNQPFPSSVSATRAQMDSIDPDFKLPTVWKLSLGYDHALPWMGLVATAEIQQIRARDAVFYKALNIGKLNPETGLYDAPTGTLADGRNSYWCKLGNNASSNKNCGANSKFTTNSTYMTNTDQGKSTSLTLSLNKPLSNNWYGNLSYTRNRSTEVGSDGSSQAWSSYQFVSRVNPNEEVASTATRQIQQSVKLSLGWEKAFFGNYKTSITAYYNGHDGLPYTWLINGDPNGDGVFQDPAYIPLINDPKVSYGTATAAQIKAFQDFIDSDFYLSTHRGQIAGRNETHLPWINQLDMGLQQEIPGFFKEHKAVIRLDIYNVLNMLNKDWGITNQIGGFDTRYLAGLKSVKADGTYEYNLGTPTSPSWQAEVPYDYWNGQPSRPVSRWSLLMTLRYEF